MVLQTIDQAPIEPFVVQQSDVDIFDSLDELDVLSPPTKSKRRSSKKLRDAQLSMASCTTLPEDSVDIEGVDRLSVSQCVESFQSFSSNKGSRRSSLCSTTSSNSSVCSKSFGVNDGDESLSSSYADGDASSYQKTSKSSRRRSSNKRPSKLLIGKQFGPPKHVAFDSKVTIRSIPDIDDYSDDERCQVWYNEEELQLIKEEAQQLIQRAKTKEMSHKASELRGLHMTQKRQRRSLWLMALTCVLDEQKRQARNGISTQGGADNLAKLYKSFAFSAVQIAQKIGQDDAEAAALEPC